MGRQNTGQASKMTIFLAKDQVMNSYTKWQAMGTVNSNIQTKYQAL